MSDAASAVRHYLRAVDQSLEGRDVRGVGLYAERGLACGAAGEARGHFLYAQLWVHIYHGDFAAAQALAREAQACLPAGSTRFYQTLAMRAAAVGALGDMAQLQEVMNAFDAAAPPPAATAAHLETMALISVVCAQIGLTERAADCIARLEQGPAACYEASAATRGWRDYACGWHLLLCLSDPFRAHEAALQSNVAFDEVHNRRMAGYAGLLFGIAQLALGAYEEAETSFRWVCTDAGRLQEAVLERAAKVFLAFLLLIRQQPAPVEEMLALLNEPLQNEPAHSYVFGLARCAQALALAASGDLLGAEVAAGYALEGLCWAQSFRPYAFAVLSRVLLRQGRAEAACEAAEEGLRSLGAHGSGGGYQGLLHLMLAEGRHALVQPAAAQRALAQALGYVQECAALIPEPAARERFLSALNSARVLQLARAWDVAPAVSGE